MKKNQSILIIIVIGLLLMGASFYAGTRYQASQRVPTSPLAERSGMRQQGLPSQTGTKSGQQNGPQGGGIVNGEVVSLDGQSMTVKMPDGSSKIVIVAGSTSYQKSLSGALTDVAVGGKVTIIGTTNSDGSVTAKTVMVGDTLMLGNPAPIQAK